MILGTIYFSSHSPDFLDAIFGLTGPSEYDIFNVQPEWQELLLVYDPKPSKTQFLGLIPPRASGGVSFLFFPKLTFAPLGPCKGPPGSTFGPLGPLRAHLVLHLGPWCPSLKGPRSSTFGPLGPLRAHTPPEPEPEPEPDELSIPNQAPLPSRPGTKYVAQGILAATSYLNQLVVGT